LVRTARSCQTGVKRHGWTTVAWSRLPTEETYLFASVEHMFERRIKR